jgi:hypothetical protein
LPWRPAFTFEGNERITSNVKSAKEATRRLSERLRAGESRRKTNVLAETRFAAFA